MNKIKKLYLIFAICTSIIAFVLSVIRMITMWNMPIVDSTGKMTSIHSPLTSVGGFFIMTTIILWILFFKTNNQNN